MAKFPEDPKKLKPSIRRYERQLRRGHEEFGFYDDSFGKRYLIGPLYLMLNDLPGALKSFEWFEQAFPDDSREPFHLLCWTLALYCSGNLGAATQKLRETMLATLYLIPHLLGLGQGRLDILHGTNWAELDYLQDAPPEFLSLWDPAALRWAEETYHSPDLIRVRARYIEIFEKLKREPPGPRRSQLVRDARRLRTSHEDQ